MLFKKRTWTAKPQKKAQKRKPRPLSQQITFNHIHREKKKNTHNLPMTRKGSSPSMTPRNHPRGVANARPKVAKPRPSSARRGGVKHRTPKPELVIGARSRAPSNSKTPSMLARSATIPVGRLAQSSKETIDMKPQQTSQILLKFSQEKWTSRNYLSVSRPHDNKRKETRGANDELSTKPRSNARLGESHRNRSSLELFDGGAPTFSELTSRMSMLMQRTDSSDSSAGEPQNVKPAHALLSRKGRGSPFQVVVGDSGKHSRKLSQTVKAAGLRIIEN
mmetsp:Transcript_2139/g.4267  ORF Transcript_2139/g.4267 Transcript_2139/m.4267 type:complete len:277 (-) Transcript_2139:113-943(-)